MAFRSPRGERGGMKHRGEKQGMKLKIVLLSLLFVLGLGACAGKASWTGNPELARKLTLKMPEADVRKLLGEPTDVLNMDLPGIKTSAWIYKGSKEVRLVVQDGKLVAAELGNEKLFEASISDL
jgi:hypothetical protein